MPRGGHYIDFTGSGLYTNSQLQAASQELATHLYANPHCTRWGRGRRCGEVDLPAGGEALARGVRWHTTTHQRYAPACPPCPPRSPSSLLVDAELRAAREMVLAHFSADPREYAVVFTRWGEGEALGGGWGGR
jgi:hypothetical protein